MITNAAREDGVVIFAGAGVSMVAPTSLPNWYQFNEAVLRALADSVIAYTRKNLGEWIFGELLTRRDESTSFAPDYMADIIAEEAGLDYFRVLQALDTEEANACHRAVAALAREGLVRAIVTTNFDRLFERTLAEFDVPYRRYARPEEFTELRGVLEAGDGDGIPLVKVHGTADSPETMVDTLSQRLFGRPEDLDEALKLLYGRHHVLFLGFSGADLDYDAGYLALRGAASNNCGFTYLTFTGSEPRPAILELADAWGEGAEIVEGTLPDWLAGLLAELNVAAPDNLVAGEPVDRMGAVSEHAAAWAESLGRLQGVNILGSLLRAAGDDPTAGRLYWSIWRHYRLPEDCEGPTYARFNHQLGRYLREYGFYFGSLRPPTNIAITIGDTGGLDKDKLDNAYYFLTRSLGAGFAPANSDLAVCQALIGQTKAALNSLEQSLEFATEKQNPFLLIDAVIDGGVVWSLAGAWSHGLELLEPARKVAIRLGHEPRRARLCAHLVRFLAWGGQNDDAEARYSEGRQIAERLGMLATAAELDCSLGFALTVQGRFQEAVDALERACTYFEQAGRLPQQTRAAIDLGYAAMFAEDEPRFEHATGILTEFEVGYGPHVHLFGAEFGWRTGDLELARSRLEKARETGVECTNEYIGLLADKLEKDMVGSG